MSFWAAGFWSEGFWSPGFWGDEVAQPQPAPAPGGAGFPVVPRPLERRKIDAPDLLRLQREDEELLTILAALVPLLEIER